MSPRDRAIFFGETQVLIRFPAKLPTWTKLPAESEFRRARFGISGESVLEHILISFLKTLIGTRTLTLVFL